MFTFFSLFWFWNIFYQILVTYFVYWLWLVSSAWPALVRECLWCLFLWLIFIINVKHIRWYWNRRKSVILSFILLILISVVFSYLFSDTSLWNMIIWIKYWFRWMFILITSWFLWYIGAEKWIRFKIFKFLPLCLVSIVIIWFIRQWAKLEWPDFFYSIWYGWLNNYVYWDKPPIYYLTWYEWTLRWQWLFSWPNNYWYFLVAFLPFIRYYFSKDFQKNNIKNLKFRLSAVSIIVRIVALILTLSRAVLVGIIIVCLIMFRNKISKNKKILIYGCVCLLLVMTCLSILKRESTIWHITSKIETIPEIISSPLWHWLWSSWPAVHYNWVYLPENYYLQIMLDIWTVGFIFRVYSMIYILWMQYNITSNDKIISKKDNWILLDVMHSLQIWFFALLIMWLFLHVFEDSMVNYLFFTIYWIVLWILSKDYKGLIWWKIVIKK